jgi:hypothetical protein
VNVSSTTRESAHEIIARCQAFINDDIAMSSDDTIAAFVNEMTPQIFPISTGGGGGGGVASGGWAAGEGGRRGSPAVALPSPLIAHAHVSPTDNSLHRPPPGVQTAIAPIPPSPPTTRAQCATSSPSQPIRPMTTSPVITIARLATPGRSCGNNGTTTPTIMDVSSMPTSPSPVHGSRSIDLTVGGITPIQDHSLRHLPNSGHSFTLARSVYEDSIVSNVSIPAAPLPISSSPWMDPSSTISRPGTNRDEIGNSNSVNPTRMVPLPDSPLLSTTQILTSGITRSPLASTVHIAALTPKSTNAHEPSHQMHSSSATATTTTTATRAVSSIMSPKEQLCQLLVHVFDAVQEAVLRLMQLDSFARFHGSLQHRTWLEEYKGWTPDITKASSQNMHHIHGNDKSGSGSGSSPQSTVEKKLKGSAYHTLSTQHHHRDSPPATITTLMMNSSSGACSSVPLNVSGGSSRRRRSLRETKSTPSAGGSHINLTTHQPTTIMVSPMSTDTNNASGDGGSSVISGDASSTPLT